MWSKGCARRMLPLAAIGGLAVSMSACQSFREAIGAVKEPPDEFAVVTKAPLIIPPDYHLRPPKPGAAPLNQLPPTESAEAALYSDNPKTVASSITGSYSEAEKLLLARAGAASANDSIRQQIAADNSGDQSADDSFTDRLLFGGSSDAGDSAVDPNAEKARIAADKSGAPQPAQQTQAPQNNDSGWLDGIF